MSTLFLVFAGVALASSVASQGVGASSRADVQAYLESVYGLSNFASFSDAAIYQFFNALTFYYEDRPTPPNWPKGRKQSHPYAGTVCDCLHINLTMCETRPAKCEFWPLETYLNLPWVLQHQLPGFPSNAWFEGLTYPGEWGFPISCQNYTLGSEVYAWHRLIWLYPITGSGVWFNTGNTAAAYNKVGWLLQYGKNAGIGTTPAQIMDSLATMVCNNYQQLSSCNATCADPDKDNPAYCCCHGRHGLNLGMQIVAYKNEYALSWNDALTGVAKMYSSGQTGAENYSGTYPNGTYFGYLDLLDPTIKYIQSKNKIDTVQLLREPQHGGYHSDPVYAFEILYHAPFNNNYYYWTDYCNEQQTAIAVLDPTKYSSYLTNGYIPASGVPVQGLAAFTPRPAFAALFQSNM